MHVDIRGVTHSYARQGGRAAGNDVLREITLGIREGEFLCLLGPSGCGKSTLLRLIAGMEKPVSGEIEAFGRKVAGPSPERGLIFQDYALFPWLTVRQNIDFGLEMRGTRKKEREETIARYLQLFGLEECGDFYPKQLSGGMRQRVAIARSLCLSPRLLLMDEPFAALDAMLRHKLQDDLLGIWARERITFVLVTHDVEEAVYLADRIVLMTPHPGRVRGIVPVTLPRPRRRESGEFAALRASVLARLTADPALVGEDA
ncbi:MULTISPECIES: ABC transporter ATP-binding protein [Paenibacillus]|uniref:ABC transporter ATP-binding protein n=1 Tax=Paenibacillus TaxID=44249 RepID=UPI0022B8AE68|nr:ABC transporter ATP-binding protein [Paenibacillus caseinilyticus]MCZ8521652.1 ABC transporter ATP-binding protein [Paenibacillus caseinilyticus]